MNETVMAIPAPRPKRRILAPLLGGLSMFGPFSIDTIFPAFPALEAELRASPIAVQQTISTYMVAYAVMALVYGPLSDAFGRRRVILAGLVVYALASFGCAHAHDLDTLLVFRALQGMSAGVGLIVGRAIIRDCFDGAEAQKLMATVSMIFAVAPALAPIVGGWVIAFAHWPMIFLLLAGFAIALTLACAIWLPETHPPERRVGLSLRELAATNRSIVTDRAFLPLVLSGSFNFNALWVYISSAPVFVIDMLKLDAQQFGWLFVPAISGMMLGSFLSGRVAGRLTAAATIRIGYAIMLLASVINLGVTWVLPQPQLPWSVLPIGLHAIGIGLSFPTLTLLLLDRFPHHRGAASSVQAFVSLLISALIAGALAPVLSASPMRLALAATIVTALGLVSWRIYLAIVRRW
ncbi:MAG: multidrug effflux MFS transporter [Dokdonella sp.]|nr:multidrug effflux MFS transporter [Dokdonella sp.]